MKVYMREVAVEKAGSFRLVSRVLTLAESLLRRYGRFLREKLRSRWRQKAAYLLRVPSYQRPGSFHDELCGAG